MRRRSHRVISAAAIAALTGGLLSLAGCPRPVGRCRYGSAGSARGAVTIVGVQREDGLVTVSTKGLFARELVVQKCAVPWRVGVRAEAEVISGGPCPPQHLLRCPKSPAAGPARARPRPRPAGSSHAAFWQRVRGVAEGVYDPAAVLGKRGIKVPLLCAGKGLVNPVSTKSALGPFHPNLAKAKPLPPALLLIRAPTPGPDAGCRPFPPMSCVLVPGPGGAQMRPLGFTALDPSVRSTWLTSDRGETMLMVEYLAAPCGSPATSAWGLIVLGWSTGQPKMVLHIERKLRFAPLTSGTTETMTAKVVRLRATPSGGPPLGDEMYFGALLVARGISDSKKPGGFRDMKVRAYAPDGKGGLVNQPALLKHPRLRPLVTKAGLQRILGDAR